MQAVLHYKILNALGENLLFSPNQKLHQEKPLEQPGSWKRTKRALCCKLSVHMKALPVVLVACYMKIYLCICALNI